MGIMNKACIQLIPKTTKAIPPNEKRVGCEVNAKPIKTANPDREPIMIAGVRSMSIFPNASRSLNLCKTCKEGAKYRLKNKGKNKIEKGVKL